MIEACACMAVQGAEVRCLLLKLWPTDGVYIPNTKIADQLAALDPAGGRRGEDQIKNWRTNNFKVRACTHACMQHAHKPGVHHILELVSAGGLT